MIKKNFFNVTLNLLSLMFIIMATTSCGEEQQMALTLPGNMYDLHITNNSSFYFTDKEGTIVVPQYEGAGILINDSPIERLQRIENSLEEPLATRFEGQTSNGTKAIISVKFTKDVAQFKIVPENEAATIKIRTGGMPVAHGLGDAGAYGGSYNLVKNDDPDYEIKNNGGTQRWLSTFAIFPKNDLAGVFFDQGAKTVTLATDEYAMEVKEVKQARFFFLIGKPKSIYHRYRNLKRAQGYFDVLPKFRFFEPGWESWDALGWNTDQYTVKKALEKFLENDYPIKWAVTGSGFWEQGGTTTSFGQWGKSFSDHTSFKQWMNSKDIKWLIGQRINFVPSGGPFTPESEKRDRNLTVNHFNGNPLSQKGLDQNFFIKDRSGEAKLFRSGIFPLVDTYVLDGRQPKASEWFHHHFDTWGVEGIKEDTMIKLDSLTEPFNRAMNHLAKKQTMVMARNGNFNSPGTLLRINDTRVDEINQRIPINYFQYAASGAPNVYSDVIGVHQMDQPQKSEQSLRHAWLQALTAGMALGVYPEKWTEEHQRILKRIVDFKVRLAPTFYNAAFLSYLTGYPYTLTPVDLAYPDMVSKGSGFEWMIGESLLATPLLDTKKGEQMTVELPDGIWYDYDSGKKYEGPVSLEAFKMPIDKTPCFVGGRGLLFERSATGVIVKIYPLLKKQNYIYTFADGKSQAKLQLQVTNWEDLQVTSDDTNTAIKIDRKGPFFQFEIEEGRSYTIK